jgi:hypothetical protein
MCCKCRFDTAKARITPIPETLARLEANGQILLRYSDRAGNVSEAANSNGSVASIAGIMNEQGTVFGLMPHPEAASETILGSVDGLLLFRAMATPLDRNRPLSRDGGFFNTNADPTGATAISTEPSFGL